MTSFQFYILTRLDSIGILCFVIAIISGMVIFWLSLFSYDQRDEIRELFKHYIKLSVIIFIISISVTVLLPTTKEALLIYSVPQILNNKEMQKLPDNVLRLLNEKIEEWRPTEK